MTNARDDHITKINLENFQAKNIATASGPNGLAITPFIPAKKHQIIHLGLVLPLSGTDSAKGREMMLGYELWRSSVNQAGGILVRITAYDVNITYLDTQPQENLVAQLTTSLIKKYHVNILLATYGNSANQTAKQIAVEYHIPWVPSIALPLLWRPNALAVGEDLFASTQIFDQYFQTYYNLKASALSANAVNSGIMLQQALLQTNSFITIYPNAQHGFDNPTFPPLKELTDEKGNKYHIGYNAAAQQQAARDLIKFFKQYLLN